MFKKTKDKKINDWDIVLSSEILTPMYNSEQKNYQLTMENIITAINNTKYPLMGSNIWLPDKNGNLILLTDWIKKYGGEGLDGTGSDLFKQYRLEMRSSHGNIIKDKNFNTTLSVVLYENNVDVTAMKLDKYFKWSRVSGATEYDQIADAEWNLKWAAGAKEIPITADDVNRNALFQVQYVTENESNLWIDEAYKAYMSKISKK